MPTLCRAKVAWSSHQIDSQRTWGAWALTPISWVSHHWGQAASAFEKRGGPNGSAIASIQLVHQQQQGWHLHPQQLVAMDQKWGAHWRKPPRKVSYRCTFGAPDQGQMLDMWESQTTESALRWWTCHIVPRHILEVALEVILEHVLRIKTMTSLILDHVAIAYLYLGIIPEKKSWSYS